MVTKNNELRIEEIEAQIRRLKAERKRLQTHKRVNKESSRRRVEAIQELARALVRSEKDGLIDHVQFLQEASPLAKRAWAFAKRRATVEHRQVDTEDLPEGEFWERYNG